MLNSVFSFYDWLIENAEVMGDGPGLWCPLHITLMCLLFTWLVASWFLFKKYKKFALVLTTVLCYLMLFFRLFMSPHDLTHGVSLRSLCNEHFSSFIIFIAIFSILTVKNRINTWSYRYCRLILSGILDAGCDQIFAKHRSDTITDKDNIIITRNLCDL